MKNKTKLDFFLFFTNCRFMIDHFIIETTEISLPLYICDCGGAALVMQRKHVEEGLKITLIDPGKRENGEEEV